MPTLSKLLPLCFFAVSALGANAQNLPADIEAALARSRIPKESISLYVIDANPGVATPLLSHRANASMNPASVMKLVTTVAALDMLGPAYTWQTQVLQEPNGDIVIKGGGDPKLVVERLWLLLNRLRSLGVDTILGNLILDSSAFATPVASAASAAAFDGEPSKPYNASPDALLVNYKSVVLTLTPASAVAAVQYDPPLAGVEMPKTVPLSSGDCSDYRGALKADFFDPKRFRFAGSYPKSCGERAWPIAYADPAGFAALAVRGLWESMGGKLIGASRTGQASREAKLLFTFSSPSLGEVIRDMNKYSNNVMAQHLFLTLSLNTAANQSASFDASRAVLAGWWKSRYAGVIDAPAPIVDNGSGLSRTERITASALGRMLQDAYAAPYMPEFMASLPQSGVDGTLRRSKAVLGVAHLKTGSLNNVAARAGYVHAQKQGSEGKRYVLIAIINSDSPAAMAGSRSLFDALVDWTAKQ